MDPVTALGLAVNVLQLVEHGIKIAKKVKEVHDRGSLAAHDEVERWAEDIAKERKQLQGDLTSTGQTLNRADKRVLDVAKQSIDATEELKKLLNNIAFGKRQAGSNASSLKLVLRSYLKKSKVEELTRKLQACEAELGKSMLTELYVRSGTAAILNKKSFDCLTADQQEIIRCIVATDGKSFDAIKQLIEGSAAKTLDQIVKSEEGLRSHLEQIRLDDTAARKRRRLLESLHFEIIDQRRSMIRQRVGDYGHTFRWVFMPDQSHGFHEWLKSKDKLYWISGKPGSGKSSLIDYILEHLEPKKTGHTLLQQWAAPAPLLIASAFFYKPAADPLQKNYEGLWRSLCFQLLTNDTTLIQKILTGHGCPQAINRRLSVDIDSKLQWMVHELEALFFHLLGKTDCHVFILIDGLDEFAESHVKLLDTIKHLAALPRLKLCCSSRADAPFDSGLAFAPDLKVQDLTYSDIRTVVKQRLCDTRVSSLIETVIEKAEGVFLWAHLVSEDIVTCMMAGDSMQRLERLLDDAPGDMSSLFAAMVKRAHPSLSKRPKPYLQCLCEVWDPKDQPPISLSLSNLLIVDSDQAELQTCLEDGFTIEYMSKLVDSASTIRQQVSAHCAGLVHIYMEPIKEGKEWSACFNNPNYGSIDLTPLEQLDSCYVAFVHRCAFDFLRDDPAGQAFLATSSLSPGLATFLTLRAKIVALRLDASWPPGPPADIHEIVNRGHAIGQLAARLERCSDLFPEYHQLTIQWLGTFIGAVGDLRHDEIGGNNFLSTVGGSLSSVRMTIGGTVAWYFSRRYNLVSWFRSCVKTWTLPQQQIAVVLVWCLVASHCGDEDFDDWLGLLAHLQVMCGPDPVTSVSPCSGFVGPILTQRGTLSHYDMPTQSVWTYVVATLADNWLSFFGFEVKDLVFPASKIWNTLVGPHLSGSEPLELVFFFSHSSGLNFSGVCLKSAQGVAPRDNTAILLRCILEDAISLLLQSPNHRTLNSSEFGQRFEFTHWKPKNIDKWLELQNMPDITLPSILEAVRGGGECECVVTKIQLAKLSKDEIAIVQEKHIEIEPGRYKLLPKGTTRDTFEDLDGVGF